MPYYASRKPYGLTSGSGIGDWIFNPDCAVASYCTIWVKVLIKRGRYKIEGPAMAGKMMTDLTLFNEKVEFNNEKESP